jgi:hypothetical protein
VFEAMLNKEYQRNYDVSGECVVSFLQFLYYGETDDGLGRKNVKQIQELIELGSTYEIPSLIDACVGVLMKKPYEVDFGLQEFLDLFTFAQTSNFEKLEWEWELAVAFSS